MHFRRFLAVFFAGLFVCTEASASPQAPVVKVAKAPGKVKHCFEHDAATGRLVPPPPGTLGPQAQMYCAAIEAQAIAIELPGVTRMNEVLAQAFRLGAYDVWVLAAEDVLSEFQPELATPVHQVPLTMSDTLAR